MNGNDALLNTFYEEAGEILSEIENLVMDLEADPGNKEQMNALFRVMHTLKGSSGMVGLDHIYTFTHHLEDILDSVRVGDRVFTSELANLCLSSRDWLVAVLENSGEEDDLLTREKKRLVKIMDGIRGESSEEEEEEEAQDEEKEEEARERSFRIHFEPHPELFRSGVRPLSLIHELRSLGDVSLKGFCNRIPPLNEMEEDLCYVYWDIILTTQKTIDNIRDIFIFVENESKVEIKELEEDGEQLLIGEILKDRGYVTSSVLDEALTSQKKLGEVLLEKKLLDQSQLDSALLEQQHLNKVKEKKRQSLQGSNIRVNTQKLDIVVNLVGELVTLQARLAELARDHTEIELDSVSEDLQRLVEDLRDSALSIRMLPIGTTFASFRRLVRDLSRDLGKSVQLITEGGETELDKTVIERLNDPLIHLIRNCIDHGLEGPDLRRARGKKAEGTIKLSASHSGGHVIISVEDDGGGISRKKVLEKAISKGIMGSGQELSDDEIYRLLFESGFSTSEKVSQVSGRGVGMDVVKKEIEKLQGSISIASKEGKFTKISFSIPLTLAIVDGLLVRIREDFYIIPLSSVESCIELTEIERNAHRRDITHYRDHLLPYIRLREFLDYSGKLPSREQIVVVRSDDNLFGLVVDQVVGDHQTVIKNLGRAFRNIKVFSGATIMGNGQIALILNINTLSRIFIEREKESQRGNTTGKTVII